MSDVIEDKPQKYQMKNGRLLITDFEMDRRLRSIADLAKKQRCGPWTTEADAMQALELIELLALILIESFDAKASR